MSQRLGMADGRCFTISTANSLLNDYMMSQNGINYEDNYTYRRLLQQKGPEILTDIMNMQKSGAPDNQSNFVNQCQSCNTPLLRVPNTY